MRVRRATADDWQAMRSIRLQALQEAPMAFASTYEREVAFPDEVWRARLSESSTFLAEHREVVIGTATGYVDPVEPEVLRLVAMFVVPEARGRGCAYLLVDAVVADARSRAFGRVLLDVVEGNTAAHSAYVRYGFRPTGVTSPLPHHPELAEIQLEFRIT